MAGIVNKVYTHIRNKQLFAQQQEPDVFYQNLENFSHFLLSLVIWFIHRTSEIIYSC